LLLKVFHTAGGKSSASVEIIEILDSGGTGSVTYDMMMIMMMMMMMMVMIQVYHTASRKGGASSVETIEILDSGGSGSTGSVTDDSSPEARARRMASIDGEETIIGSSSS
jgi:hypothetical protein